jgi:hypothetical protein
MNSFFGEKKQTRFNERNLFKSEDWGCTLTSPKTPKDLRTIPTTE